MNSFLISFISLINKEVQLEYKYQQLNTLKMIERFREKINENEKKISLPGSYFLSSINEFIPVLKIRYTHFFKVILAGIFFS